MRATPIATASKANRTTETFLRAGVDNDDHNDTSQPLAARVFGVLSEHRLHGQLSVRSGRRVVWRRNTVADYGEIVALGQESELPMADWEWYDPTAIGSASSRSLCEVFR